MSGPVIIRLQNLPLEARSIDIRRFFEGLVIPDGGVHIIGGERGDAFIAFQSDEDARQAMARDGYLLCSSKIKLFLSSKTEMQNVIAAARNPVAAAAAAPSHSVKPANLVMKHPDSDLLKSNSISQILGMVSGQPSTPATANLNNNSIDLLSSLSKLISSSSSNTNTAPNTAPISLMSTHSSSSFKYNNESDSKSISPNILDQLKSINTLVGQKETNTQMNIQNDPITTLLAKVNPTVKPIAATAPPTTETKSN